MSVTLRRYFRGATLATMVNGLNGERRTYHLDHQGTVQCLTNAQGVVTDRFACVAWGNEFRRTGASINRQWYIGNLGYYRQVDQALDYVRARLAVPARGVWLSRDPVRGQHPYAYADVQPTVLADASGLTTSCRVLRMVRHQDHNCCHPPKPLGGGDVELWAMHYFTLQADVECVENLLGTAYDQCCIPPNGLSFCQALVGNWVEGAGRARSHTLVSLAPSEWCPDLAVNSDIYRRGSTLNNANCIRHRWRYDGPQQMSRGTTPSTIGGQKHCRYSLCMIDAPGYALDRLSSRFVPPCFGPVTFRSFLQPLRFERRRIPALVDLKFKTWVCDDPVTGRAIAGPSTVLWKALLWWVGDARRQTCPGSPSGC